MISATPFYYKQYQRSIINQSVAYYLSEKCQKTKIMERASYYTTCVIIFNLFVSVYSQLYVGDYCASGGREGQCQIITNCPSAIDDLGKGISPFICGFQGAQSVVCCFGGANPPVKVTSKPTPPTPKPTPVTRPVTIPTVQTKAPVITQKPVALAVGDKSRAKCKEYVKYVYEYVVAGAPPTSDCAIITRPLIVGGEDAKSKEFGHMALVGFEGETPDQKQWQCGASLISEQFVLTAGHCLFAQGLGEAKYVRLGELVLNSNNDDTDTQDFNVQQIIRHPDYRPPSRYNDIGLLKLDRKARLSTYVRPACLETNPRLDMTRKPLAAGWGKIGFSAGTSDALQKVTLEYFAHAACNKTYKSDVGIRLRNGVADETQICAGSRTESKDTCQGDSGGPLQIVSTEEFCMYKIVGITSFGKGCGAINIPAVYTRVSSYIKWIEDNVWP